MIGDRILLTDFYQLTMLQTYFDYGMNDTAVFDFFVRKMPANRNFLVAAGLEQVIEYLEQARFTEEELEWLAGCGRFKPGFVESLADWHFTGDVDAMPEGTLFFPDEPVLRVTAPLREAQLIETRIVNLLQFQSMVASKAVRCVFAAQGRQLVDFGLRRAHGAEAGLFSARASYLAGFDGTATVLAGMRWEIPVFGTMAHSYILAHDSEHLAFEHFARSDPGQSTLLIDTYDTESGAQEVVDLAHRLAAEGGHIGAVRLDSGDLGEHARRVRQILDEGQLPEVRIFASGNLDEYRIHDLVAKGAPIDGFGVGTRMNTSADAPYLDCAYKLHEYAGRPRRKRSEHKITWPGRKQVWRQFDAEGQMQADVITLAHEVGEGKPLLQPVMVAGRRTAAAPSLNDTRQHVFKQLRELPEALRNLESGPAYPVKVSESLQALARQTDAQYT